MRLHVWSTYCRPCAGFDRIVNASFCRNMADEETNRKLVKWCPELASEYGKYPLQYPRWLDPKEKDPQGRPCFIQGPDAGMKEHYAYGPGKYGRGYYHLLTLPSYQALYAKLSHETPGGCCACSAAARKEYDEYDDVKRIVHARSKATVPNDAKAYDDAIADAQVTAQMWYNGTQNEQLAINTANVAAGLSGGV